MLGDQARSLEVDRELQQLLRELAEGNQGALCPLVRRTRRRLLAAARAIQRNPALAEEALQDAYLKVWRSAGDFDRVRAPPMAWMVSIVRNQAIDSVRRQARRPMQGSAGAAEAENVADTLPDLAPGPLEQLVQAGRIRQLHDCIDLLPPAQRQALHLAYFEDLTHLEIAQRLERPVGTVKSWVRRSLLALRCSLEARTGEA
jgi:RNA polymerase sigma factor (sigma-70 family)